MFNTHVIVGMKCLAIILVGHFILKQTPSFFEVVILYSVLEVTTFIQKYLNSPIMVNLDMTDLNAMISSKITEEMDNYADKNGISATKTDMP